MKEVDDLDLKAEIDQISQRIDAIVQQVEKLDPETKDQPENDKK